MAEKKVTKTTVKTIKPAVVKKTLEKKSVAKATVKAVKPAKAEVKTVVKEVSKSIAETKKTSAKDISVEVFGLEGEKVSSTSLPGEIFGAKVNPVLMAQAVRVYLANQREGTASTKTRGEVAGTTKKIYRQKGTGRARHGAAKAPIFVGGGISFGPKPHSFSLVMPKKMRRTALFSALSSKVQDKKLMVVDFSKASGKTKEVSNALKNMGLTQKNGNAKNVLLIADKTQEMVRRAGRNIEGVSVQIAGNLNTYEVLQKNVLILTKESIDSIKNTFAKGN